MKDAIMDMVFKPQFINNLVSEPSAYVFKYPHKRYIPQTIFTIPNPEAIDAPYFETLGDPLGLGKHI